MCIEIHNRIVSGFTLLYINNVDIYAETEKPLLLIFFLRRIKQLQKLGNSVAKKSMNLFDTLNNECEINLHFERKKRLQIGLPFVSLVLIPFSSLPFL